MHIDPAGGHIGIVKTRNHEAVEGRSSSRTRCRSVGPNIVHPMTSSPLLQGLSRLGRCHPGKRVSAGWVRDQLGRPGRSSGASARSACRTVEGSVTQGCHTSLTPQLSARAIERTPNTKLTARASCSCCTKKRGSQYVVSGWIGHENRNPRTDCRRTNSACGS